MAFEIKNLSEEILAIKKNLREALPNHAAIFSEVEAEMKQRVATIVREREAGEAVIPTLQYADIEAGNVSPEMIAKIKERGACLIRQTFPEERATAWGEEIAWYVEENGLTAKLANAAVDNYFGDLKSAKRQIYGIYWSRPQVQARQAESLTRVRVFLNKLWKAESEGKVPFDPNHVHSYADRIRRRPPGSATLGLSPHVDGGSVERWLDENFRNVFAMSSQATGAPTMPSMRRGGLMLAKFPRLQSAPCSGPSRVGQR